MKYLKSSLAVLAGSLLVYGCDLGYDFENIDSSFEARIDNLVVPVNLDELKLESFIDVEENGVFKVIGTGTERFYAVSQAGSFSSEPFRMEKVSVSSPDLGDVSVSVGIPAPGLAVPGVALSLDIPEVSAPYAFETPAVDARIKGITSVKTSGAAVTIDFSLGAVPAGTVVLKNLEISLPKGLICNEPSSVYDPATGVWKVSEVVVSGGRGKAVLVLDGIDLSGNGNVLFRDSRFVFSGESAINSGVVAFSPAEGAVLPSAIELSAGFNISTFEVTSVSGTMSYDIEGLGIDPVSLGEMPDFLSGGDCNIILGNPQLYLKTTNPVYADNISFSTGIELTAYRNNGLDLTYMLDNGRFTIAGDKAVSSYVFAPSSEGLSVPEGFGSPEFVKFSGLANILGVPAGVEGVSGLPDRIGIALDRPMIPLQEINDFALGRTIDGIAGEYEILAPLALGEGSVIVYSDDITGIMGDEDAELSIDMISINADVANTCPAAIELHATAIDAEGNELAGIGTADCRIEALSSGNKIELQLKGDIKKLDGIRFKAVLRAGSESLPFSPDQGITLSNIRIALNGSYLFEL